MLKHGNVGPPCITHYHSLELTIFAAPKRGRPTPGFSIFIRSNRPTDRATFVRLHRSNFGPYTFIKGQRDKGTTQVHRNKGTTQEQRDSTGTKEQRNKGTKEQQNKGTKEQKNKGTKEQRNKGTKEQRNKGTKKQRNKETKSSSNWVWHNQVSWSSL